MISVLECLTLMENSDQLYRRKIKWWPNYATWGTWLQKWEDLPGSSSCHPKELVAWRKVEKITSQLAVSSRVSFHLLDKRPDHGTADFLGPLLSSGLVSQRSTLKGHLFLLPWCVTLSSSPAFILWDRPRDRWSRPRFEQIFENSPFPYKCSCFQKQQDHLR